MGGNGDGGHDSGVPLTCVPNEDGTITRDEVPLRAGLRATYMSSGSTSFDTAGTMLPDGGRLWDFTPAMTQDLPRQVATSALTGLWFENDYPDAGYVAPIGNGELLAIFQVTPEALLLRGLASPTSGLTATRLLYTPPVKVLDFPLTVAKTWSTNTTVTGRYMGGVIGVTLPYQTELYESTVDLTGQARTPYASTIPFSVLRVRTKMTRKLALITSATLRTQQYVTECFGTVATVSSREGETTDNFTSADEVRRLAP